MEKQLTERRNNHQLESLSEAFIQNRIMTDALDLAGVMILAITDSRQIVYANGPMLDYFQKKSVSEVLGLQPGEAMACIHAQDSPDGCGAGPACPNCPALTLMIKGISSGNIVEDAVLIERGAYGINTAVNLRMKVVPYQQTGETCYMLTLQDNTDGQRRRELERIFFHDILNATGAIKNYLLLLSDDVPDSMKADIEFLNTALAETIEDIHAQKSLGDAESLDYQTQLSEVSPREMCHSVMNYFKFHREKDFTRLSVIVSEDAAILRTDARFLRRILVNMVKNALEATTRDQEVRIRYEALTDHPYAGRFGVWNPGYIDPVIQLRIFTRSFSTKGYGRGLGTYSMKLFGEKYLRAEVDFVSTEDFGTEFYILMPEQTEGKL